MSQTAIAADPTAPAPRRAGVLRRPIFAAVTTASGVFVLVLLGAIIVLLFIGGLPGVPRVRPRLPGRRRLGPGAAHLRRRGADLRHLVTSVLALIMAVPLAFGIAFFLTELAPAWLRRPVGTAVELLAAVPSIIYGMWGFFVIVPFMAQLRSSRP